MFNSGGDPRSPESTGPGAEQPPLAAAGMAGLAIGLLMVWFAVGLLRTYGAALFLGAPFVIGLVVAFIANGPRLIGMGMTSAAVMLTLFMTGLGLLAVAAEGLGCIIMSLPLAVPLALVGAKVGVHLAGRSRQGSKPVLFALVMLPIWGVLEPPGSTGRVQHEVFSAIEIDAAPTTVWPRVIAFDPLPAPDEFIFKTGVAFPLRAHIDGTGVGAVRYCVFSTGAFVEPVTSWEPGARLAFDVAASPPPMIEWSPYPNVKPPHLDGFLRARRGEFRLVPIGDGRTRLEGRTWYEIEMAPERYWHLWSDYLIHRVHMRVLEHIKRASEAR